MNLTQLRYFQELVRNRLVVSAAARALGTSQPAVSQQLRALEASLGTPLVLRNRNRLTGLTPVGEALVEGAEHVLSEVARLEALGSAALAGGTEPLRVVSSHMQARFGLPQAIRAFHAIHPTVEVRVSHYVDEGGGPWRRIQNREADIAITSEVTGLPAGLMAIPCSPVGRVLIAPRGHPLLKRRTLSLADIAEWPLITFAERSIGRNRVVSAFLAAGIEPRVAVSAVDEDMIKACVEQGSGVSVVASLVFDRKRDRHLGARDVTALFGRSVTHCVVRRSSLRHRAVLAFVEAFTGTSSTAPSDRNAERP